MPVTLVVADGQQLVREALAALLERDNRLKVVALAHDGQDLYRQAKQHEPDVAVADFLLPGMSCLESARRMKSAELRTRVLCLSDVGDVQRVMAAVEVGIEGFMLKQHSGDELRRAVQQVHQDRPYFSSELMAAVLRNRRSPDAGSAAVEQLTIREREVARLLSEGLSTQEVADRLSISPKTVATHREHVFEKLRLHNVVELARFALSEGLSRMEGLMRTERSQTGVDFHAGPARE